MLILTIRTDKQEAELGLFEGNEKLVYETWQAHRELASTIHLKIDKILGQAKYNLELVQGIVFYKGPGSFTGLRVGASVANALAFSLNIPIVEADTEKWQEKGINAIISGINNKVALPEYGAAAKTTSPKK